MSKRLDSIGSVSTDTGVNESRQRLPDESGSRPLTPKSHQSAHNNPPPPPTFPANFPSHGVRSSATVTRQEVRSTTPSRTTTVRSTTPLHSASAYRSTTPVGGRIVQEGQILSERIVETEVIVPKLHVREETVMRTIQVPETIRREEIVEERQKVQQKIIEVGKVVEVERYEEEIVLEERELVHEYHQTEIVENIIQRPRVEVQYNIIEKKVVRQNVVEVPVDDVKYVEREVEQIVEVPTYEERVIIQEVVMPRVVERPVPEFVDVHEYVQVARAVPVPVECTEVINYKLRKIVPRYERVPIPIYAPRFVEVPVPMEQLDEQSLAAAESLLEQVEALQAHSAPSLCEIESVATMARSFKLRLLTAPQDVHDNWKRMSGEGSGRHESEHRHK